MKYWYLLLCFPLHLQSQNTIGIPDVMNYTRHNYHAGLQNWDFRQDKSGILYVANNEGLLQFDGNNWILHRLPNKTIVRSVEIGADGRIYAGGQDELGYFEPDAQGRLRYHSLTRLLTGGDRSFGDVWDIVQFQNAVFFRTPKKIFRYQNESVQTYNASSEWSFLGACNGQLYAHDYGKGLLRFSNNAWPAATVSSVFPQNDPVTAVLPIGRDTVLITSLKNGLFILTGQAITRPKSNNQSLFAQDRIYTAIRVNEEWVALGTSNGGVHIIDHNGNIIQDFSKTEGLQNNNVLSLFLDRQENLWLGLDNGISFIAYNSAIKQIRPMLLDGSGYTAQIHENRLYIGTSNGLYSAALQELKDLSFSRGNFTLVNNTSGQNWNLAAINNQLLLGHHDGAFIIENNTAKPIATKPGFWNFIPLGPAYPSHRIATGFYQGLSFFDWNGQRFTESETVPGFEESSRFVAIDKYDRTWVSHPYHGVHKIVPAGNGGYRVKTYTDKEGLPSVLNNHIYKIRNEVVVATEAGVYSYNSDQDRFEPAPFFSPLLGRQSIRYLREDMSGHIWFIHEKTLGVIDMTGKVPQTIYFPELSQKMVSGFECIYPVDEFNIFLGGEKGFYHINFEKYRKKVTELSVQVRQVHISNQTDSLLFGGYFSRVNEAQLQAEGSIPEISHDWKSVQLHYASPLFGLQSNLEYSFRLKGFENNWSEWTKRTDKEYTNLNAGNYVFEVKVRNNLGNESPVSSYAFRILPPWYLSGWAALFYLLSGGLGLFQLYKWQKNKFRKQQARYEEEQKKLRYIHELELNKTESELVALRNEKLEAEINFKNSELASSAMHLFKKGELLTKVKTGLTQVMKQLDHPHAIGEIKKMIKSLNEDDNMDKEWENFSIHFDKVHSDFVTRLKEKFPAITGNELKLSAYLRMNLSSKEIAQLLNISVRGVEISRYRLRKKLGIPSETNLFDYLMNL